MIGVGLPFFQTTYVPPALQGSSALSTVNNAAALAVSLPPDIAAGERLLIFISGQAGVTRTVSAPAGWLALYNDNAVSGALRFAACFTKLASGSEGGTVAVAFSGGTNVAAIAVRVGGSIAHCEVGSPLVSATGNIGVNALTPSANGRIWLVGLHKVGVVANAAPASWNYRANVEQSGNVATCLADRTENIDTLWPGPWASSAQPAETRLIAIW